MTSLKIHGVKRFNNDIFFTRFKKHYCPECGKLLNTIKMSKVVNSASPEAVNFDFSNGDVFLVGNIKFIWVDFECKNCDKVYSVNMIREFEKPN